MVTEQEIIPILAKTLGLQENTIRKDISLLRRKYPALSNKAAGQLLADKKGMSIRKYLSRNDRIELASIGQELSLTPQKISINNTSKKINTKKVEESDFSSKLISEANSNAEIYPYIYILENTLREIILDTYSNEKNWWDKKSGKAKESAERIKEAEKKHDFLAKRGMHNIYYIGLEQLAKIIEINYKDFKKIFINLNNFKTWIDEITGIRNLVAHNVKVNKTDKENLKIRTTYICRQVNSKNN